ncbi:MAG: peptidoglycan-binding protein [Alphaproteobacteria bacterium]
MKPGVPWSVKGIQPKARAAAKDAARGAGVTLGQWLNEIILEQNASDQIATDAKAAPKAPARSSRASRSINAPLPLPGSNLDGLAARLDTLAQETLGADPGNDYDDQEYGTQDALNGIARSVENHHQSTQTVIQAMQSDIALLARKVGDQAVLDSDQLAPGMRALEKALFNIVDHIELSDRRNGEVLKAVQMRLSDLTSRAGNSGSGGAETAAALNLLEGRLGALVERFDALDTDQGSNDYSLLENQVVTLGRRVDDAQRELRENPTINLLEARLDKISARLDGNEHEMSRGVDVEALTRVVTDLREDFDRSNTATRPAVVQAIETRLHTLSGDLDTMRGDEVVKNRVVQLAGRLDDVTARLSSTESGLASAGDPHPQIAILEMRIETLANEIAGGALATSGDALKGLESQINVIADRLNQTEERFSAPMQSIEASLSQLFESLEKNRIEAIEAAEQTAVKAAQKVLAGSADAEASGDHAGAFNALETGLAEVRAEAGEADRRTHETLEAVHDTLERVIDRLGALEAQGQAAPPASEAPSAPDLPLKEFRLPPLPGAVSKADEPGDGSSEPEGRTLEVAEKTEPASDKNAKDAKDAKDAVDAEGPPAGSGTDFSRAYDIPGQTLSRNEDFIAAARRAAQAANAAVESEEKNGSAKKKDQANGSGKGHRRTILFAVAALFIAVGAMSVSGMLGPNLLGGLKKDQVIPASVGSITPSPQSAMPPGAKYVQQPSTPQSQEKPTPRAMSLGLDDGPQAMPGAMVAPGMAPDQGNFGRPERVSTMVPTGAPRIAKSSPPPRIWPETGSANAASAKSATSAKSAAIAGGTIKIAARTAPQAPEVAAKLPLPAKSIGSKALRQAAASGQARAQFEVGARFAQGRTGLKDFGRAATWYQRAAAQGLAPAQYRLGALYEKGQGVAQDKKVARLWYQRAAEQGNIKAMHNLGVILTDAALGRPDFSRAARWFQKAAQEGLTDSQYNLGVLHERGLGVERDAAKAYKWFAIAGAKGDVDAAKRQSVLEKSMSPAALAAAHGAVKQWRPRTPDQGANVVAGPVGGWGKATPQAAGQRLSPATIARTQLLLKELGYLPGAADGIMGPQTGEAIAEFERERGLAVSGRPSHGLIKLLEAAAV